MQIKERKVFEVSSVLCRRRSGESLQFVVFYVGQGEEFLQFVVFYVGQGEDSFCSL